MSLTVLMLIPHLNVNLEVEKLDATIMNELKRLT
jgi:hypothetical protein